MIRLFSLPFLLLVCLPATSQAPDKAWVNKSLDSLYGRDRDAHMPGVAFTLLHGKEVLVKRNLGQANLEQNTPFTHETPVRLGYSGTREFMCVALALMEAESLLSFQDKARQYFPRLPDWSDPVTIRDLLNHASGFCDEWATLLLMHASMLDRVDTEQLLDLLYNQPTPQVPPGEGYLYSNSDFALLRLIMEKASGMSLPDYLEKNVFTPVGMTSTFMNDDLGQLIPGLADNYHGQDKYTKSLGIKTSPGANYRMVTTASDLEKWAIATEDPSSPVSMALKRLYRNARPIPVLSPEVHYTFGHEWHKTAKGEFIVHGGVNGDFYLARIPSLDLSIVSLGNGSGDLAKARDFARLLLEGKPLARPAAPALPTVEATVRPEDLQVHAGRYFQRVRPGHSSSLPMIVFYDIRAEAGSLRFYFADDASFELIPLGRGLFKDPDYGDMIQFSSPHPDSAGRMEIWLSDGRYLDFEKSRAPTKISPKRLLEFTGEYYSRHLGYPCRIVLADHQGLVIRRPTVSDKPLVPYGPDAFLFEMEADSDSWYVVAEFTRDKRGKIDGINMQHVRMMHHRFEKVRGEKVRGER